MIFDELDKSKSHILIDQLYKYFRTTAVGQQRASLIVPEPFFVHSDLTTGVQFADLLAYVISWAWRNNRMRKPARPELSDYAAQAVRMKFDAHRVKGGQQDFIVFGFAHITDLRTNLERFAEVAMSGEG